MSSQIKVLSKSDRARREHTSDDESESLQLETSAQQTLDLCSVFKLKLGREATTFKLIDEKEWNIVTSEPSTETTFFTDGHSAMSILSVIGPKGVGKSTLLNKLARKEAFKTYVSSPRSSSAIHMQHVTRGIDIHSTHHRMLLDCQPLLASSVLDDFLSGRSNSQFPKNSQISDPLISCQMISLQLATFLIATSDYVIIMTNWLIDVHLLRLISSAIMMIGEDNLRARFIMFSEDPRIHGSKFKSLVDNFLGKGRIEKFLSNEEELYSHIAPYSSEKCELYHREPATFTGKNWLSSCQRLWNSTIKNSSMFTDYALQLFNSNYV